MSSKTRDLSQKRNLIHLFIIFTLISKAAPTSSSNYTETAAYEPLQPLMVKSKLIRRQLHGSFRVCALCTCCGGPKRMCFASPCCYAINCNIPNRPFGFCAFTPKSCNCFGCHL